MNSKFQKYWEQRSEIIQEVANKSADDYLSILKKSYIAAKNKITEKTEAFYGRYAKDNQIDLSDARKRLTPEEVKTFKEYNAEYYAEIKSLGDDAFTAEYKAKLRDMSGRAYISRQQELMANINHEIEMLYIKQNGNFADIMKTVYKDGYYQNIYNLQQTGLSGSFTKIYNKTVEKAVAQKWHSDNFSGRIWQSKENLIQWLENNIPKDFVRGYGARELAKDLAERMAIKYHEAEHLVRTETSHISNQATIDSYKEMGIEYYKILAEIDNRTSEICADMNGKVLKTSEAVAGITVPPLHPNCRSTTVAYFPEDETNVNFDPDMNGVVSDMVQDILNGDDIEKTFTEWAKKNSDGEYAAQVEENSGKYKDFDRNMLQFSENSGIIDITNETRSGGAKMKDDRLNENHYVNTGGLRNENPLTQQQINEAIDYIVMLTSNSPDLYLPLERIRYTENYNIAYGSEFDVLYLGTDTYPIENAEIDTKNANSRISWKGAIAHELVGHREAKIKGLSQENLLFEEAQASIRAARFAPALSEIERITLLRDAVYRLNKNGFSVSEVKGLLNIKER